jgi:hypothetical protein
MSRCYNVRRPAKLLLRTHVRLALLAARAFAQRRYRADSVGDCKQAVKDFIDASRLAAAYAARSQIVSARLAPHGAPAHSCADLHLCRRGRREGGLHPVLRRLDGRELARLCVASHTADLVLAPGDHRSYSKRRELQVDEDVLGQPPGAFDVRTSARHSRYLSHTPS